MKIYIRNLETIICGYVMDFKNFTSWETFRLQYGFAADGMADGICGAASDEVPGFLAGIRGAAAEASGAPGQEGVFPIFFWSEPEASPSRLFVLSEPEASPSRLFFLSESEASPSRPFLLWEPEASPSRFTCFSFRLKKGLGAVANSNPSFTSRSSQWK